MNVSRVESSRVEVSGELSSREIKKLATDIGLGVIQTATALPTKTWQRMNAELFSRRPDIELRVYGFYSDVCDLGFARLMTNVRRFSADCLHQAINVEAVGEIPELEALRLGIFDLVNFDVLDRVSDRLVNLSLHATKSRKPNLSNLSRFERLRELYLEGQQKNIDVIAGLTSLKEVTLRSITTENLDYLSGLSELWSLDLKLGGTTNLGAIANLDSLKYLEIWQVRGLSDISVISDLFGLQNLFLQSLSRIESLPSLDRLTNLRRIYLENMKGLHDLSALETAPALEQFILIDGRSQSIEEVLPVLRNPRLKCVGAYFGSDKRNQEFEQLAAEHGKSPYVRTAFEYR